MLDVTGGEVDRMAVMIHQLLDISRIEEGRMQMYITQASIIEIAQFTLDNYYPAFTKGGNRLRFAREGDVPDVKCDRARIVQVLVNLIGNATRHTRRGEIEVVVSAADGFAEVCVRDNGDGMSTEQLEHLFERYRTSSRESSGAQGLETGTGLGLFICQHIINAHGGRIWIESESGHGTRAHFTVPLDT